MYPSKKSDHTALAVGGALLLAGGVGLAMEPLPAAMPAAATAINMAPPGKTDTGAGGNLKIFGTLRLPRHTADNIPISELSGLAWDEDEQLLYAVSDQGYLYHLQPLIQGDQLLDVTVRRRLPLRHPKLSKLPDAEGLVVLGGNDGQRGNSELVISREGDPGIDAYTPAGQWLRREQLPQDHAKRRQYATPNKGLEALAHHPQLGLISAAEMPMRGQSMELIQLFSLTGWRMEIPRSNGPNCGVVALETTDNSGLLILERCYQAMPPQLRVQLRYLPLPNSAEAQAPTIHPLANWDTAAGWRIDNFEGLTRIGQNRYLMISDDNDHPAEDTLLVYFEFIDNSLP